MAANDKEPATLRLQVAVGTQVTHLKPRGYYLLRLPPGASREAVQHVAAQVRTFLRDAGPDAPKMAVLAGDITVEEVEESAPALIHRAESEHS